MDGVVPVTVEDMPGKMVEDAPLADVSIQVVTGDETVKDVVPVGVVTLGEGTNTKLDVE